MEELYKRDYWEQGRGLDLWSVPHFLFGVLMAMLPPLLDISFMTAFALMMILALVWEVYEKIIGIKETLLNILFDVILPVVGFVLTANSLLSRYYDLIDLQIFTAVIFVLYMGMNTLGWYAHVKREQAKKR